MDRSRRLAASGLLLTVGLAACAGGSALPVESSRSSPRLVSTAGPSSPTPGPQSSSSTPRASDGPVVLDSIVYPYSLTVPPATLTLAWTPARRPWDGQERIDFLAGGRYVDKTGVRDGILLIFGAAAPKGIEAFYALDASNGSRYHGCSTPAGRRDITINGVGAITFTQACSDDQTHAAVAMDHDGFGLGVVLDTGRAGGSLALDYLVDLLKGLAWKNG